MIKLTEIVAKSGNYDQNLGKNTVSYNLRDVFVNPSHVVTMRDDEEYNDKSLREELVKGLSGDIKFTRLNLNVGGNITLRCTVTGTPESIMRKFSRKSH